MSRSAQPGKAASWGGAFALKILQERQGTLTANAIEAISGVMPTSSDKQFHPDTEPDDHEGVQQLGIFDDVVELTAEYENLVREKSHQPRKLGIEASESSSYHDALKQNILNRAKNTYTIRRIDANEELSFQVYKSGSAFHTKRATEG